MFDLIVRGGTLPDGRVADIAISGDRIVAVEPGITAEAAEVMRIPVGTVMSRVCRARATLRRLLDDTARPAGAALRRVV